MTLILNGTDNSATTPAVTGTDTDTGVYYPAANQVALATNGTLALIVDSSQNVGIGTSGQSARVAAQVASGTAYQAYKSTTGGLAAYQLYTSNENVIGTVGVTSTNDTFYLGYTTTPVLTWNQNCVGVGGAIPSTSGAGITFPATQSASSNANTLDDYEEGTWTPSAGGNATYTTQAGTYTKVGNIVTAWFDIQISVLGTGSPSNFSGLPYVSRISPSNPQGMAGSVGYFVNIATASTLILVRIDNNSTTVSLSNTAGVTSSVLNNSIFGNGARITGTITYQANA